MLSRSFVHQPRSRAIGAHDGSLRVVFVDGRVCVLHNYVIKGPLCEIAPPIIQIWGLTFHLVTQNANYVTTLTRRVAYLIQGV